MKTNKSITEIEKRRKNSRFFQLVDSIPYNNSKVGQSFIMKVSSRKKNKQYIVYRKPIVYEKSFMFYFKIY